MNLQLPKTLTLGQDRRAAKTAVDSWTGEIDRLVLEHLPLVRALARRIHRTLPPFVAIEDLESLGTLGLVEASRRFDPDRGVKFKTFVYYRIRGSILDGVRKMIHEAGASSTQAVFQSASTEILRDASQGLPESGMIDREALLEVAGSAVENVAMARFLAVASNPIETIADPSPGPAEIAAANEQAARIRSCLSALDERERSIIEDYYFNDRTLEEAGARIGLSKSWTSRLHARALGKLATAAKAQGLGGDGMEPSQEGER